MANKVASKRWIYSNFSVGSSSNECATKTEILGFGLYITNDSSYASNQLVREEDIYLPAWSYSFSVSDWDKNVGEYGGTTSSISISSTKSRLGETDVAAGGERYTQITKLDLVHTVQYTDCKGNVKVITNTASTVLTSAPSTSNTIVNINTVADKAIDIIIPNGVSIVNQAILNELPTSLPVKGHCAYSVFELQIPVTTPTPTAETKSK